MAEIKEKYLFGVDQGNANMKTRDTVFPSGLRVVYTKPETGEPYIKYKDEYYVLSDKPIPIKIDKTEDEKFFVLTLFAIMFEAEARKVNLRNQTIQLAVGLPPADFSTNKKNFEKYFDDNFNVKTNNGCTFIYNDKEYKIYAKPTYARSQAYAAIFTDAAVVKAFKEYDKNIIIIDIGGGTCDIVRITNGKPIQEYLNSLRIGTTTIFSEVEKNYEQSTKSKITRENIEKIIQNKKTTYTEEQKTLVKKMVDRCVNDLLDEIIASDTDLSGVPIVFVGGGSITLKNNIQARMERLKNNEIYFINDIKANAKGYEKLFKVDSAKGSR